MNGTDQKALADRIAADPKGFAAWLASWFSDETEPEREVPEDRMAGGKGYALLVGLDRVDPAAYGGWDGALGSCVNDAKAMRALCGRHGFDAIDWLHNASATRERVAFEVRKLADRAHPGDTALIFQSRHGGRIPGDDGPGDRWIETHVLYDGQMLDDEFRALLACFRAGVTVVVILDTCHAEGATKAAAQGVMFYGESAPAQKAMPSSVVIPAFQAQREHYCAAKAAAAAAPPAERWTEADVIEMAACGRDEYSYSGSPLSEYTRCLVDAAEDWRGDYHALHARIVRAIRTNQHPKLTGPARALERRALWP